MAYGPVNVPGVSKAELDAVKTIAQKAQQDAGKALEAAGAAQDIAEDVLLGFFGGTLPSSNLADNSPATIQKAAQLGMGANFWSVGDKVGILLNGTVGALSLNDTYYAYILGFNHNEKIEGPGIDFQFGKTADGVSIAFVDEGYKNTGSTAAFRMTTNSNTDGGWENSFMRKTICPAFLAVLPEEWQGIISECTKYSDNVSRDGDIASNVTATKDKIWLLAEFEAFGSKSVANSAEQNYQKQYEYFANGNSRVKYKHNDTGSVCKWWLRSTGGTYAFCCVPDNGTAFGANLPHCSYGFAPGFKVA